METVTTKKPAVKPRNAFTVRDVETLENLLDMYLVGARFERTQKKGKDKSEFEKAVESVNRKLSALRP